MAFLRTQELPRLSFSQQIERHSDDISFYDANLKLNYDIARNQSVDAYGIGGHTLYRRVGPSTAPGPNDFDRATYDS